MPETVWGLSTEIIGIWLAALLTLAIYSFLYKDNPVYKVAEHLFVGTSAGYSVAITWHTVAVRLVYWPIFRPNRVDRLEPDYWIIIPAIIGLLMFFRFIPRYAWLARWPLCFVMGYGAGATIPPAIQNLLVQAESTMLPVAPRGDAGIEWFVGLSSLIMMVAVITTLCYFYFSKEHKGAFGVGGRAGIWFLMIAFGAGFGNTVMARISLLLGRVQFLIEDWLPLITGGAGGG